MNRRSITLIALMMIVLILPVAAFAATGNGSLTADSISAEEGETVAVAITISTGAASSEMLNTFRASIAFDAQALSYTAYITKLVTFGNRNTFNLISEKLS